MKTIKKNCKYCDGKGFTEVCELCRGTGSYVRFHGNGIGGHTCPNGCIGPVLK